MTSSDATSRRSTSPSLSPWAWDWCAFGAYLVLTIAITWPLVLRLGTAVPKDLGDPLFSTWAIWWNATALPFTDAWWNAPIFFPSGNAMALADHRVGLGVITTPLIWAGASPVTAYGLAFLASFMFSAAAAYFLALEVSGHRPGAFVAGLVFGFHPFRAAHLEHVELLSSYWLALALLCLHRWIRTRGRAPLVWLFVVLTLQALTSGYYYFYALILLGGWVAWFALRQASWRELAEVTAALVAPLVAIAPVLWRYRTAHTALGLSRSVYEVEQLSADIAGFLAPPSLLAVWNQPLTPANQEVALFPGATAVAVVLLAIALRPAMVTFPPIWPRVRLICAGGALIAIAVAIAATTVGPFALRLGPLRLSVSNLYKPMSVAAVFAVAWLVTLPRVREAWARRSPFAFYVLATLAMWLLALGPTVRFLGERVLYKAPYGWLMMLPGFNESLRAPARFAMLAAVTLGVAAALAIARLAASGRVAAWSGQARTGAFLLVAAGATADGWLEPLPLPEPPARLAAIDQVAADAIVLELPLGIFEDTAAMYRSMAHHRRLANGYSGYAPPHYTILGLALMEGRPQVLAALELDRDLAIVVARPDSAPALSATVASVLPGAPVAHAADADIFTVARHASPPVLPAAGPALPVREVTASSGDDPARAVDGSIATVWITKDEQAGGEQVTADIGATAPVAGVELDLGRYTFAYPRMVSIEVSDDAVAWQEVWRGDVATAALRGALVSPSIVPVRFTFATVPARFVRITQLHETEQPWAIAELHVLGPSPP